MSMQFRNLHGYSLPGSFLNTRIVLGLFIGEIIIGVLGFMWFESYNLEKAWYMTIITISTVGYTEEKPFSPEGELFATFLILINIGIFAYLLATFSYYVIQGEFFKKWHLKLIMKQIDKLDNHVIVCGYGRHGKEIADHFIIHDKQFVIIENDPETISEIQSSEEKLLYISGDATRDEVLQEAGIGRAAALITALPADSDNIMITLSAKQINPGIDVISRATAPRAKDKLIRAGADHVVLPEQIGGFFMATLVSKPGAMEFLTYVTNEKDMVDIAFEEIRYDDMPLAIKDKTLGEVEIGPSTGTHIIGFIRPNGDFIVNPKNSELITAGSSLITLGTREQLDELASFLGQFKKGRAE